MSYDWAGRPLSSSQTTAGATPYAMSYQYNLAGKLTSFTFPSGRQQTLSYDTAGRLSGASGVYSGSPSPTSYASSFGWFPNGALANVSLGPNGLLQQYCQNTRLQTTAVRAAAVLGGTQPNCANNGDLLNIAYSYGATTYNSGNVVSETLLPLNKTETFTYDAYDRLSAASEGTTWSQSYAYDVSGSVNVSYGNRYVSASTGFTAMSFTPTAAANFNAKNQLVKSGITTQYDNSGNLSVMGAYSFTYDAEGRQTSVNTTSYSYDGEGRRVRKLIGTASTVYVYDAEGNLVAEYASNPPAQVETEIPTTDPLGSTRLVSNADGVALGYHDYLPFGEEIAGLGGRGSLYGASDGVTQRFTGKERDAETGGSAMQGLDYFGARYFSSTQGRFTSPDPITVTPGRVADPQQLNL